MHTGGSRSRGGGGGGGGGRRPRNNGGRRGKERRNNKSTPSMPQHAGNTTQAWLDAIQEATKVVVPSSHSSPPAQDQDTEIAHSLNYLERLANTLEKLSNQWDQPPSRPPPRFRKRGRGNHNNNNSKQEEFPQLVSTVYDPENPFTTFHDDDDDEEEESVTENLVQDSSQDNNSAVCLAMRRLMIRVVTAQSELYAHQASPPHWRRGADLYYTSLSKIHYALELADSECARWLQQGDIPTPLSEDANVVQVAIQHFGHEKEYFWKRAVAREAFLKNKLEPQWQSRNQVKERWGEERWNNNPHPRQDYARMRRENEREYREIHSTLRQLEQLDTEQALQSSRNLQEQVLSGGRRACKPKQNRHNGQRPSNTSQRVSQDDYPDPTRYGWTFTGSCNDASVEYFENSSGFKLDWHFCTATLHVWMNKKQLFAGHVTPEIYLDLLLNPRMHSTPNQLEFKPTRALWFPDD